MNLSELFPLLKKPKKQGSGYVCLCPAHEDKERSLSVTEKDGKILANCFAGCSKQSICDAWGIKMSDLFLDEPMSQPKVNGVSLKQLAEAKNLPMDLLVSLGWQEIHVDNENWIKIPYFDAKGEPARTRFRTRLVAKEGTRWKKEKAKIVPYGLSLEREEDYCVFVEGETDTLTLLHHGYPALGIPGASNIKCLETEYFQDLERIYITQENDQAGKRFVKKLARKARELGFTGKIYKIPFMYPVKDPNDLHISRGEKFKESFDNMLQNAQEVTSSQLSDDTPWLTDKGVVITGIAAKCIFDELNGNLIYAGHSFWEYENGSWVKRSDLAIEKKIQHFITIEKATKKRLHDIKHVLQVEAYRGDKFEFNPNPNLVCLQNGVLDAGKMEFIPHCREFYHNYKINASWDKNSIAPKWNYYLESLGFSESTVMRLQEWAGYCFSTSTKLQRALILYGIAGSGKSIFIETISRIMGNELVSAIDPADFKDKYQSIELYGKMMNVCGDIRPSELMSENLKKIIRGEDVDAQCKFKGNLKFKPHAKHIYSCNKFPATRDHTEGFYRSYHIIEFKNSFTDENSPHVAKRDYDLQDKLYGELDGIFMWAMEGLERLISNNWNMTNSEEFDHTFKKFRNQTDTLKMFLDDAYYDNMFFGRDEIPCDTLREYYVQWCHRNGHLAASSTKLGIELKEKGWAKVRKRIDNKQPYFYVIPIKLRGVPRIAPDSDNDQVAASLPITTESKDDQVTQVMPIVPNSKKVSPRAQQGKTRNTKTTYVTLDMIKDAENREKYQEQLFDTSIDNPYDWEFKQNE